MIFKSHTSKRTHLVTIYGVFKLHIHSCTAIQLARESKVAYLLDATGTLMIYLISVCLRPPVLRYWPYGHTSQVNHRYPCYNYIVIIT